MVRATFAIIVIAFGYCVPISAAQIRVPLDQPTIQLGINSASSGDTVLVSAGIYNEAINYINKDIIVVSESGPQMTIIDSHRTNRVVTIAGVQGRSTRLEGFTLRNGSGGLYLNGASATILNNIIITNATCTGPGIDVEFCSPLIISNICRQFCCELFARKCWSHLCRRRSVSGDCPQCHYEQQDWWIWRWYRTVRGGHPNHPRKLDRLELRHLRRRYCHGELRRRHYC
jgi:hypothetical protein